MDSSLTRYLEIGTRKEEATWLFKMDMANGHGRCIKRYVRIARKSVKFPSSPAETVQFTVKIATQSEKIAVVKKTRIGAKNARFLRVRKIGSVKLLTQTGSNLIESATPFKS